MQKSKKWFNNAQLEAMMIAANNEFVVASRGFGKSEGIDAPRLLRNVVAMPGGSGALLSPTYSKLLSNTLPAVCHALDRMGYKRDIHYFVGRRPPKDMKFEKPIIEPFKWDYVMSWYNGSIVHLLSFDRPMSANSLNLDWIMGFEAKYLDYKKIVDEVFPANRGNEQYFGNCPWHHGLVFSTDMPTFRSGQWILEKRKDMDKELILAIKQIYPEYIYYKSLEKRTGIKEYRYKSLKADLILFRKNATFYAEYDIFDNLEIIGEKRIRDFKRDLPPFIFNTSILNIRPYKVPNGFYSALNEKIHCYESSDNAYLDSLDYNIKANLNDCRKDGDLASDAPLRVSFDYNASINNVVTGQKIGRELRTQNWQFVKTPRKLQELCDAWCDYYHYFPNKNVIFYYDATSVASSPDGNAKPFYEIITDKLSRRGWNVNQVYIGQPMKHALKHEYIDQALKGSDEFLFPTFNKHNTEYLFMAMEQTGIKMGRNGFEKDKGIEKTPDSPDNPDELKTHGTDAWDTFFIGCNFYDVDVCSSVPSSVSWG